LDGDGKNSIAAASGTPDLPTTVLLTLASPCYQSCDVVLQPSHAPMFRLQLWTRLRDYVGVSLGDLLLAVLVRHRLVQSAQIVIDMHDERKTGEPRGWKAVVTDCHGQGSFV